MDVKDGCLAGGAFFFAQVRRVLRHLCRVMHPHFLSVERKRAVPVQKKGVYIGSLDLEELHTLRNRVRCTWLRHESLLSVTDCNRALLS